MIGRCIIGVSVARVLPTALFEERNPVTTIYIFFPTNGDLNRYQETQQLKEIELFYRKCLAEALYPTDRFPVTFHFDSNEHVEKAYGGNLYNYLR